MHRRVGNRASAILPTRRGMRTRGCPPYEISHPGQRARLPAGAAAPVFPGAIESERAGCGEDLVDLAGGEELDLAHPHRLPLQARVELQIDRNVDHLADAA